MSVKILKENNMKDLMKALSNGDYSADDVMKAQKMIEKNKKLYDSLDSSFETSNDPNDIYLPDGSRQKSAFISNDPGQYNGVMITISGYFEDPDSDIVTVAVSITYNESDDDDYDSDEIIYYKDFDYYKKFESAVKLANNLVRRIKPEMSPDKVAGICEKLGMEEG